MFFLLSIFGSKTHSSYTYFLFRSLFEFGRFRWNLLLQRFSTVRKTFETFMFCVSSWHTCLLLYLSVFLCGPFTIFLTGQKYIIILAFPCPFPGFSLFCPLNFHFACPFLFASPYFFFASVCVLVLTFPFSAFLVFVVFAIALNAIFRFAFDSFLSFAFLLHFLLSHFCLLESNISNHFNTRHIKQLRLRPFTLTSVV